MPVVSVYLDQNVFGHILDAGADWRTHPLVRFLLETHKDQTAVWISPTHVIELVLCSDIQRRQALAQVMLELCGARRMWTGPEFFIIEQFGAFLNAHIPGAFDPRPFFSEYKQIAERLWLGYLGLLAASPILPLGPGVDDVRLAKAQTSLIHARIAADPDASIQKIIECARAFETTADPDPLGLSTLTLAEIQDEILALQAKKTSPTKRHIERLKKERALVAATYGAVDIGAALQAVFKLPCDLELTFDTPLIVKQWPALKKATGCISLPKEIAMAAPEELRAVRSHVLTVLQCGIQAAASAHLSAVSVGYYTVLRELEVKLNQGTIPKGSVALDVDHATACMAFNAFVCHDAALHDNMRSFAAGLGTPSATVIRDVKELEALCAARTSRPSP